MTNRLTPGAFTGFDSMQPQQLRMLKSTAPSLDWTRFSSGCISKLTEKLMTMYDKNNSGELSTLEINTMMKDAYSSSKKFKLIDQADVANFKNFHDINSDGK